MKIAAKLPRIEIMKVVVQLPTRGVHDFPHVHKKVSLHLIGKLAETLERSYVIQRLFSCSLLHHFDKSLAELSFELRGVSGPHLWSEI